MNKTSRKTPIPLLNPKTPVDWWFLFKLNSFEEPGAPKPDQTNGLFDVKSWKRPSYETSGKKFSQHYLFASSRNPELQHGRGILGSMHYDPLGSTFEQVYAGSYYYVLWNDQFYGDPAPSRGAPWGHSKGMLAWNEEGEGLVMQVSTPSWPASGSSKYPRQSDGNTLGYVSDDDIEVSQHFFALKITKDDLVKILTGLKNASVVTGISTASSWNRLMKQKLKDKLVSAPLPPRPDIRQVINNGGPEDVQKLVKTLGRREKEGAPLNVLLSSGVRLISKPSSLAVPPWQMVSAELGGIDLRVASWWSTPRIYSTTRASGKPGCWGGGLGTPGAVDIATTGTWKPPSGHKVEYLGLTGGLGRNYNHAKFGVSTSGSNAYCIFGDMNQQGALCQGYLTARQKCSSSQNGRGGLFYVLENETLFKSLTGLLTGESAPTAPPSGKKRKQS
ncbi:MAG: deoxyribonuclease II family protein [Pseudomonadota bacterium]